MPSIRVSATEIDSLRYFLANESAELEPLLAQLRRQSEPTEAMMAGTALHEALERAGHGEVDALAFGGYCFAFPSDAEIDLPEIRECKATREYRSDGVNVTLVGKVDAIHGRRVYDHKMAGRYDPERFMASLQWRCYLEIFGADEFVWNIFEAKPVADRHYRISNFHRLTMHRYPGMHRDVMRAVGEFVDFAKLYLPERLAA